MAVFLHAAGFHCLTFDVRGNGTNPAEALPLTAGEFGADSLAAFARAHRATRGHGRGDRRSLDGRDRGDPGGGRRSPRGCRRGHLEPGRSVSPHAPDVPARPSPDPRPHRLSAGRAHDPGLSPAARPPGDRDQRRRGDRALQGPGPARAWRGRQRRAAQPPGTPRGSGPRGTGQATRTRRRSRPSSSPTASTRGCTRMPAIARPSRASSPGRSADRSIRPPRPSLRQRPRRHGCPRPRRPSRPSTSSVGGLRTLAQVALPGATRPPRPDPDTAAIAGPTEITGTPVGDR